MPCEPLLARSPDGPDRRRSRRAPPYRQQQHRLDRHLLFQHVQIWPDCALLLLLAKQHRTQAPYDAIRKAERDPDLQIWLPPRRWPRAVMTQPQSAPSRLASHLAACVGFTRVPLSKFKCPALIHTVVHRILHMIYAENRPLTDERYVG